jgi:ribose transport system permease protein
VVRRSDAARFGKAALERYALVLAWAAVVLVFSILKPGTYPTTSNVTALFSTQATLLILAVATLIPLVSGDLDLSLASTMGLSLVLTGYLNVQLGWPIWGAIVAALAAGIGVGLLNSVLIVWLGVDSIVATLGMGTALAGVAAGISSLPIAGISPGYVEQVRSSLFGLQTAFYVALVVCIVCWFVIGHTSVGRKLFFVGTGREVARLSGINVNKLRRASLLCGALLAALAGVLLAGLFGSADPSSGPAQLLPSLAAVFLGATAVTPGRFNVWGTFIAVYFLVFGIAGLEQTGLSGWISQAFYGGSLVFAVALSKLVGNRRR